MIKNFVYRFWTDDDCQGAKITYETENYRKSLFWSGGAKNEIESYGQVHG